MITANMHEAKTTLSRLVAAVERGERVRLMRGGKPVADLVPVRQRRTKDFLRKREGLGGIVLREPADAPLDPSAWPEAMA